MATSNLKTRQVIFLELQFTNDFVTETQRPPS